MLLRTGKDIWFLLGAVRSARYLFLFVLGMLWTRVILIAVESATSTERGRDDKGARDRSSATQAPGERNDAMPHLFDIDGIQNIRTFPAIRSRA